MGSWRTGRRGKGAVRRVLWVGLLVLGGCARLEPAAGGDPAARGTAAAARPAAVEIPEAGALEARAEARLAAGDLAAAVALLEQAIRLRESVPDHDRLALAETLERLADLLEAMDRPERSSSLTERALRIRTALRESAGEDAALLAGLAWVQQGEGRAAEAEHLHRAALERLDAIAGADPTLGARIHLRLGRLLRAAGRAEEALASLERAEALLAATDPAERLLGAAASWEIAAIAADGDHYDVAVQRWARALAVYDALLPEGDPRVGDTVARLALASLLRGDTVNARVLFDRAIALAEDDDAPDPEVVARLRHHRLRTELAHAARLLAQDKVEAACDHYGVLVGALDAAAAPDPGSLALGVAGLAECALRGERPDEAREHYRRAIAALESAAAPEPALRAALSANLASLDAMAGRHAEAAAAYEDALAAYDAAGGGDEAAVAQVLYAAGNSYLAQARRPEALVRYVRALSLRERALPEDHPDLARSLDSVGAMLLERGDLEGARPLLERAVAIHERGVSAPVELGASLSYLGRVLARQGEREAAQRILARALTFLEPALGKLDPLTLATRAGLENARAPVPADRAR